MAYNHGREDRKWRIWKEAEKKALRECGVDEAVIEQIRMEDRADFNSNRRFYRWTSDFGEYLEGMADTEPQAEPDTVADLLDEIENETLYQALLTVDKHTLLISLSPRTIIAPGTPSPGLRLNVDRSDCLSVITSCKQPSWRRAFSASIRCTCYAVYSVVKLQ